MNYKVLLILMLLIIPAFSLNSTTNYTCSDEKTLFENTTYDDGTYSYKYIPCENGCLNGFCVSTTELNNYLNLTTLLLIIVSSLFIITGLIFHKNNTIIGLSLIGLGILMILLTLFLIGVYGKGFTNPIMRYVGSISFNISRIFLLGFVLIATAIVGLYTIRKRKGELIAWDE